MMNKKQSNIDENICVGKMNNEQRMFIADIDYSM